MAISCEELKLEGNKFFSLGKFQDAIKLYTEALSIDPENEVLLSNRSFCHIKLENYGSALLDANNAIILNPEYSKSYHRRLSSNLALSKFKEAMVDINFLLKKGVKDPKLVEACNFCKSKIREELFAKALSIEEISLIDSLNFNELRISEDYQGPIFEYDENFKINMTMSFIEEFKQYMKSGNLLTAYLMMILIKNVRDQLKVLPNMVNIESPKDGVISVCGDVHGQYFDLLNIFEINKEPSEKNIYLFNGDFVDRGAFSIEIISLLFCYKLLYPNYFHLNRGNHESLSMNTMFGFMQQVKESYSDKVFKLFTEVFQCLPLAHLINGKVLVVHGGLPEDENTTLDDIQKVYRFREIPDSGIMCDLLWGDPKATNGREVSPRGVSTLFGPDVTENFCKRNQLDFIIRSHEVKDKGYEIVHNGKCVTVFSAPNYCDTVGNKGSIIRIGIDSKPMFVTFEAVSHPAKKAIINSY